MASGQFSTYHTRIASPDGGRHRLHDAPGGFLATQRLVIVPYLISLGSRSATDTFGWRFPISA